MRGPAPARCARHPLLRAEQVAVGARGAGRAARDAAVALGTRAGLSGEVDRLFRLECPPGMVLAVVGRYKMCVVLGSALVGCLVAAAAASAHIERASYWPNPAPDCSIHPCAGGKVPAPRSLRSAIARVVGPSCRGKRDLRVSLRGLGGQRLRTATIYVNGRRVRTLRGRRLPARVTLRKLPASV